MSKIRTVKYIRKIKQNVKNKKNPFFLYCPVLAWSLKQSTSIVEELLNTQKFMWKIKKKKRQWTTEVEK